MDVFAIKAGDESYKTELSYQAMGLCDQLAGESFRRHLNI